MKLKPVFSVIMLLLSITAMTSCSTNEKAVSAAALDPLVIIVSERHDAYVKADPTLDENTRELHLRSTQLLRMVLDTALKPPPDRPFDDQPNK